MGKLAWAVVSGLVGLVIGLVIGAGTGGLFGSVGGTMAGTVVGVCQAARIASEQGIVDAAAADRIVSVTMTALEKDMAGQTEKPVRSLADCAGRA